MKNEAILTSQNEEILAWMKQGKRVTCLMAWIQFNCGALHSRMADLRKEHDIKDRWITVETSRGVKRVKEYWMEPELVTANLVQQEIFYESNKYSR